VLKGSLKEIKRGYGTNTILAGVTGDWTFVPGLAGVREVLDTGNFIQIKMQPDADPQAILKAMLDRLQVTHFELTEPSLEEIFIQAVGKAGA
jgi:ABC-2 type transport system ATP-binding protein